MFLCIVKVLAYFHGQASGNIIFATHPLTQREPDRAPDCARHLAPPSPCQCPSSEQRRGSHPPASSRARPSPDQRRDGTPLYTSAPSAADTATVQWRRSQQQQITVPTMEMQRRYGSRGNGDASRGNNGERWCWHAHMPEVSEAQRIAGCGGTDV
jgi:hypothetical protein